MDQKGQKYFHLSYNIKKKKKEEKASSSLSSRTGVLFPSVLQGDKSWFSPPHFLSSSLLGAADHAHSLVQALPGSGLSCPGQLPLSHLLFARGKLLLGIDGKLRNYYFSFQDRIQP